MKILEILTESRDTFKASALRELYDKRRVLRNELNNALTKGEDDETIQDIDDEIARVESEIAELERSLNEAKNHMGEREYQTYGGWKAACKKAYPGCTFRGDKDIGAAVLDGKDVGEWDGAVGSVYNKTPLKEDAHNTEMLSRLEQSLKVGKGKLKELESDLGSMKSAARTDKEHDAVEEFEKQVEKKRQHVDRLKQRIKMRKRDMQKGK